MDVRCALGLACPQEEVLAAFIDGRLNSEEFIEVTLHLVTCLRCREIVRDSVRSGKKVPDGGDSNRPKE
jgi:anti-sigma factor ChrR (cupin superfamily)